MWLSKKMTETGREDSCAVSLGEISIGGDDVGVMVFGTEHRGVTVSAPDGFAWRPRSGQQVLVLKTEDGEQVIAGVVSAPDSSTLKNGEVSISSQSASITLQNDGAVRIVGSISISGDLNVQGNVSIAGRLTVAGVAYSPCKCT